MLHQPLTVHNEMRTRHVGQNIIDVGTKKNLAIYDLRCLRRETINKPAKSFVA